MEDLEFTPSDKIVRMTPFSQPYQYVAVEYSDSTISEINLDRLFKIIFDKDPAAKQFFDKNYKERLDYVGCFKALRDIDFSFTEYIKTESARYDSTARIPVEAYGSVRRYYIKKASLRDLLTINTVLSIPMIHLINTAGISDADLEKQLAAIVEESGLDPRDLGLGGNRPEDPDDSPERPFR